MKRILIALMMIWNLFNGFTCQAQDWANKARYAQANRYILDNSNERVKVVMMGNSITEFWEELHPGFFKDNSLVGRGISGQVSSQMLARFRQDVINLNPRVVVINCGTNDIAENNGPYDEDITIDNIKSMTELALAHNITVVLTSVLPCDEFCWNTSVKNVSDKIGHLNMRIRDYADSMAGNVYYLNYFPSMTVDGLSLNKDFTEDGVHPNSRGYDMMEAELKKMLQTLNLDTF